jgi:predicted outer membrane repeat protein
LGVAAGGGATIVVRDCLFLSPANSIGMGLEVLSGLNATVTNCTATGANTGGGTGMSISGVTGNVIVENCTFDTNSSWGVLVFNIVETEYGPGTGLASAAVAITGNNFNGNNGGAGCFAATVTLSSNVFNGNVGNGEGSATACQATNAVIFSGNTFTSNSGPYSVAGVEAAIMTASNNTFTGNSGGGLYYFWPGPIAGFSDVCAMTLSGNTFTGNTGNGGAACNGFGMTATVTSNTFTGNSSGGGNFLLGGGGGFAAVSEYATNGDVTLSNNTFIENSTSGPGGGAYCDNLASITILANTFSQNAAATGGGGIYASAQTINLLDNLVLGNSQTSPSSQGGGVWVDASSELFFINNTITANTSAGGGGGVVFRGSGLEVLNVFNNIFWGNSGTPGADVWMAGVAEERIFSNNDANDIFGVWDVFTNNLDIDPHFVDSTNGNYHLVSGSPCINAGANNAPSLPLTDLDGNPRIVGSTVDLGCYEFNSAPIFASLQPSPTNGVVLQWPSVAGVNYAVQKSTDLSKGFSDVTSSLPATAPVNTYTDVPAPGTPAAFYRIRSW